MSEENDGCLMSLFWIQLITYFMAIGRWFLTDHYSFWNGFKELVWALTPIVNIFYVGDLWLSIIMFPVGLVLMATT